MLCARFQNDWTNVMHGMDEQVFTSFEFKMRFEGMSYMAKKMIIDVIAKQIFF